MSTVEPNPANTPNYTQLEALLSGALTAQQILSKDKQDNLEAKLGLQQAALDHHNLRLAPNSADLLTAIQIVLKLLLKSSFKELIGSNHIEFQQEYEHALTAQATGYIRTETKTEHITETQLTLASKQSCPSFDIDWDRLGFELKQCFVLPFDYINYIYTNTSNSFLYAQRRFDIIFSFLIALPLIWAKYTIKGSGIYSAYFIKHAFILCLISTAKAAEYSLFIVALSIWKWKEKRDLNSVYDKTIIDIPKEITYETPIKSLTPEEVITKYIPDHLIKLSELFKNRILLLEMWCHNARKLLDLQASHSRYSDFACPPLEIEEAITEQKVKLQRIENQTATTLCEIDRLKVALHMPTSSDPDYFILDALEEESLRSATAAYERIKSRVKSPRFKI